MGSCVSPSIGVGMVSRTWVRALSNWQLSAHVLVRMQVKTKSMTIGILIISCHGVSVTILPMVSIGSHCGGLPRVKE